MPGNYNALVGYGFNPVRCARDPREGSNDGRPALNAGGSSSGAGTAANFWAANVGPRRRDRSSRPQIRPCSSASSRRWVASAATASFRLPPIKTRRVRWRRTVADAAILLGVLEGEAPDRHDAATKACPRVPNADYTRFLDARALAGARIGVPRAAFVDEARHGQVVRDAIALLQQHGAIVVDPADIASQPPPVCRDAGGIRGKDAELLDCVQVRHEARLQRMARVARPVRARSRR